MSSQPGKLLPPSLQASRLPGLSGRGGGQEGHTPTEDPNNLLANSIANMVDVLGEGPIYGLADQDHKKRCIFLDDVALQTDTGVDNFEGVQIQERKGHPSQDPFKNVDSIEAEVPVGVEITKAVPVVRTVTDTDIDDIRIKIMLPSLLRINKKTGDIHGTKVELRFFIRRDGGTYKKVKDVKISGKTNAQYIREYRIPNIAQYGAGPWDVKIERLTDDSEESNLQNKTYWQSYTTVINERLILPDLAAIHFRANSKHFGNSIPSRSYLVKGLIVKVPSNYNPDFEYTLNEPVYSGVWNGSFKRAWTCNPAWIWYDLATNDRYGLGIDPSRIDKWSLYSIGQYCDAVDPTTGKFVGVSDGAGGLEPRFTMSLYLQTQEEAFHVLNAVASAFVSMPYWSSGMVCLAQDAPSDPTHLANRANVINGEFQYSGLGLKARHSVALVTWYDPDDACRPAVEVVEDPELIERFGWVTTDVLAVGCLSRSQAIRFGRWMLDSEKNQPETVTFRGSFYWADCMPGSLIRIQDPTYAGLRFGGLVASGSTKTSVKLDAPVTLEAGETYTLSVVLTDGSIADRAVTNVPGTYTTLTVEALPSAPGANAPWVLSASNVEPREFRVLVNRETAPNEFELLAVVHDSTKYARIYDNIELPAPPVSIIPTGPIEPLTNLDIQVFTHERGRNFALGVLLSWEPSTDPRVLFYEIEYRESDEDDWKRFGESTTASCERRRIAEGTYDFRIRASGIGQSNWYTESSISIADPDELPPDVTGLKTRDGGNELFTGKECELVWDDMPDVSDTYARWKHEHYKIQICDKDTGAVKRTVYRRKPEYVYTQNQNRKDFGTPARQFRVKVWAVDINGIQSLNEAILDCRKTAVDFSGAAPGLEADYNGIDVNLNPLLAIDDDDLEQMMIYVGESSPPTKLKAVVGAKTRHKFLRFNPSQQVTKYVQVVPVDRYGAGIPSQTASVVLSPQPLMDIVIPPIVGGYVAARVQATEPEDCFSGMIWVDTSN